MKNNVNITLFYEEELAYSKLSVYVVKNTLFYEEGLAYSKINVYAVKNNVKITLFCVSMGLAYSNSFLAYRALLPRIVFM